MGLRALGLRGLGFRVFGLGLGFAGFRAWGLLGLGFRVGVEGVGGFRVFGFRGLGCRAIGLPVVQKTCPFSGDMYNKDHHKGPLKGRFFRPQIGFGIYDLGCRCLVYRIVGFGWKVRDCTVWDARRGS